MKQHEHVALAFGNNANAYLHSAVHAGGDDLRHLAERVAARSATEALTEVLDLGCGAGHVSFAVAPHAKTVTAYDIAPEMLATVAAAASERGLGNIVTRQGPAEALPFADASFDWVFSRMSAHHWQNVGAALAEVRRVLKPDGRALFIDIAGADQPLLDTHIQAIELLRDASHIRDYRADEWEALFAAAGFEAKIIRRWRLSIDFDSWIARMQTSHDRAIAIRSLWEGAPDEVRSYFAVQDDGSFELDALMIEAE